MYKVERASNAYHSFAFAGANVEPWPPPRASTTSSTLSSTQVQPSSLTSHLMASSSPASGSVFQVPSSHAFRRPKTWLNTCGPTPCCARKHATAHKLVVILPTLAPAERGGSLKRAPYSLLMMKIGRSGCASASLFSNFLERGRYIESHSAIPRVFIESTLDCVGRREGAVFSDETTDEGSDARKALSILMVRGTCWLLAPHFCWLYTCTIVTHAIEANALEANLSHQLCYRDAVCF